MSATQDLAFHHQLVCFFSNSMPARENLFIYIVGNSSAASHWERMIFQSNLLQKHYIIAQTIKYKFKTPKFLHEARQK